MICQLVLISDFLLQLMKIKILTDFRDWLKFIDLTKDENIQPEYKLDFISHDPDAEWATVADIAPLCGK